MNATMQTGKLLSQPWIFWTDLDWEGRKAVLIGSVLELGEQSGEIHSEIGKRIAVSSVDAAFFFGKDAEEAYRSADRLEGKVSLFYASDSSEMEKSFLIIFIKVILSFSKGHGVWRLNSLLIQ